MNVLEDANNYTDPSYPAKPLREPLTGPGRAVDDLNDQLVDPAAIGGTNDFGDVIDAIGSAAEEAALREAERLRARLMAKRRVSIGALVGYNSALTTDEVIEAAIAGLGNVGSNLVTLIKDLGQEVASDPDVIQAVSELRIVQQTAAVLNNAAAIYNAGRRVLDSLDPVMPYIEIIARAGMIWVNPAAAAEVGARSRDLAARELLKIYPLLVRDVKNYVFGVELNLPAILLGALDNLTANAPQGRIGEWVTAIENEAEAVTNELTWQDSIANPNSSAIRTANQIASSPYPASSAVLWLGTQAFVNSNLATSWFAQSVLSAAFLATTTLADGLAVAQRDQAAEDGTASPGIPRHRKYQNPNAAIIAQTLGPDDIIRMSKQQADAQDPSSAFFTNRQMFQSLVNELIGDGIHANLATGDYDESRTENIPSGNRGLFQIINERVTQVHAALEALTGERRVNITETIPVIDFNEVENTHIANRYTEDELYEDFDPIAETELDEDNKLTNLVLWDPATNATDASIVNLAALGHQFAEYFYEERSLGGAPDLIVTSDVSKPIVEAPGLLAGLWSTPVEASRDGGEASGAVRQWRWYEDGRTVAQNYRVTIPRGAAYVKNHLLHKGTIVQRPLEYTNLSGETYIGVATATYDKTFAAINSIISTHTVSRAAWDALPFRNIEATRIMENTASRLLYRDKLSRTNAAAAMVGALWNANIVGNTLVLNADDPEVQVFVDAATVTNPATNWGLYVQDRVRGKHTALLNSENSLEFINGFWRGSSVLFNVVLTTQRERKSTPPYTYHHEVVLVDIVNPLAMFSAIGEPGKAYSTRSYSSSRGARPDTSHRADSDEGDWDRTQRIAGNVASALRIDRESRNNRQTNRQERRSDRQSNRASRRESRSSRRESRRSRR